jgi:hypothetical protein
MLSSIRNCNSSDGSYSFIRATTAAWPAQAPTLIEVIDRNEAAIEKAGVVLHSYTAPGDGHGILEWPRFYTETVNGEKLVDWVTRLIEGKPVDDVHCRRCRVG